MICPRCGGFNDDNKRSFCSSCGYSFLSPEEQERVAHFRNNRIQSINAWQNANNQYQGQGVKQGIDDKIIVIVITLIVLGLIVGSAFYVYSNRDSMVKYDNSSSNTEVSEVYSETSTIKSTTTKKSTTKKNETTSKNTKKQTTTTKKEEKPSIKETLIYDANNVLIYISSLEDNIIKFYIENNSDKNYSFTAHSFAINGIMARNNIYDMYCSVASYSKANAKFAK